ncbi:SCO3242 family prenyltransferase, partial [Streptomyces beijiangensis]
MTLSAWPELLRISALFTVPGDALAGAAAEGARFSRSTAYAIGASLCLYEAGMALNDWADREEDARDRPHRPIPSGRIGAGAALGASVALTGAGLALASRAGGRALGVSVALAATVWSYDLYWKHTPAGPAAMAAARSLDLLLGAASTGPVTRRALVPAALLGAHTYAVTTVSRHETQGGSVRAPLAALAATALISAWGLRPHTPGPQSPDGLDFAHVGSYAQVQNGRDQQNQARPAIEDMRPKVAYGGSGGSPRHAAEPQSVTAGRGGVSPRTPRM